jgi:hypothetical protein
MFAFVPRKEMTVDSMKTWKTAEAHVSCKHLVVMFQNAPYTQEYYMTLFAYFINTQRLARSEHSAGPGGKGYFTLHLYRHTHTGGNVSTGSFFTTSPVHQHKNV